MRNPESHSEALADPSGPRNPDLWDLFVFEAAARTFAIPAEQVDGTTEAKVPAVLPHAPPAVLGVVCVRGRMLTVVDPTVLLTGQSFRWPRALPCVIALRGDEQLALVAQGFHDKITIEEADIVPPGETDGDASGLLLGRVRYAGEEILVLDVSHLFALVMRQRERRRRRL